MKKKGLLIILSGPSGAGKGTVLKEVMKTYKNLAVSVSVTTRAPREGEVDDVNYHFRTIEQFKELAHNGAFLESECVYGNYYGTLKEEVFGHIEKGKDVVLEIDVKGAFNIIGRYPDAVYGVRHIISQFFGIPEAQHPAFRLRISSESRARR